MNLKDFLTNKDSQQELYWALVIEKGLVQSGIWYMGESKVEVVGLGTGIPWESEEELIEATDAALSSAIQKLPENYPEPQKTVFGVSTTWVKDGEISPENLGKIKKLCTELSLTPVGFVVLPEAIAHLYKSEEGSPLNAIILKSGDENLEMSIFKLGVLAGTTEVSRSVSLVDDVIEGLSRFNGIIPFPTRFIVYNGREGDLENIKQTLMQANWNVGKISFLHTPQIETLSIDKKVLATALAGGAEIGNVTSVVTSVEETEDEIEDEEDTGEVDNEEQKEVSLENLGFAIGEDVSSSKKEEVQNVGPVEVPIQEPHHPVKAQPFNVSNPEKTKINIPNYLVKSKELFHSFSAKIFPKNTTEMPHKNKNLLTILIALGLTAITTIALWWFAQTAKVTIYVTPKRVEENVQVVFDSTGRFDQTSGIIPARVITSEISGEKTKSTTGTKLVGDKATGTVQIANGNGAAINLAVATILTSSSGFKFVTTDEASVSGQLLPGSPGTATVNVAAYDIGSQYNLAKGEVFSVGNYSKALVAATSTGDFSGGSSQQISAVSKDDQSGLEEELRTELGQSVKADLSAKTQEGEIFVTDLVALDIATENFDHKIGDQAEGLKLSLFLTATGLAANRKDLLEYAKSMLANKAPSGYDLSVDQIDFRFVFVDKQDDKYTYNVVVGGNFLPQVDVDKIKQTILGKTKVVATDYLNSIPGFDHADIELKITFPGPLKTIPRIAKNIVIDVRPE